MTPGSSRGHLKLFVRNLTNIAWPSIGTNFTFLRIWIYWFSNIGFTGLSIERSAMSALVFWIGFSGRFGFSGSLDVWFFWTLDFWFFDTGLVFRIWTLLSLRSI